MDKLHAIVTCRRHGHNYLWRDGDTQSHKKAEFLRKSLNVLHDSFFLSEYKVLNLFICGVGTVGAKLIEQICSQSENLKKNSGLLLNVVGIASSKKAIFCREGIDLSNYR